jgi:actin-like ATPase involved in cell morphogenesis
MAENKDFNGCGVDIGTAYIVAAKSDQKKTVNLSSVRDCFLALPLDNASTLDISGVEYIEGSEELYVVGNDAINLVGVLGGELRRPLSKGFISPKEEDGKEILKLILSQILGKPAVEKELVAFSIPGPLFDAEKFESFKPSQDTGLTFHTSFFKGLITDLGFTAKPLNEAAAIGYAETVTPKKGELPLTGLFISFGAGMTNVALVYKGLPVRVFSLPFGGDYIDNSAAKATDSVVSHITLLKERGVDVVKGIVLLKQDSDDTKTERQAEAIAMMYRDLIAKLVHSTNVFFGMNEHRTEIAETIPVVISGGTTKAVGFMDLFNEVFMNGLDVRFTVSKEARQSANPLDSTATGCLNYVRILGQRR